MKILVTGSGGREHALIWKLKQSARVEEIWCAPGNAGISRDASCVSIPADDIPGLVGFAREKDIDITVVGPEVPLVAGIVDAFKRANLKIFGPTKEAAVLEGSKAFMKEFCRRYDIPTAASKTFSDAESAKKYLNEQSLPVVIKADGLAAGKGVSICRTYEEACAAVDAAMVLRRFGDAGRFIVVEDYLEGEEASFIAVCDGNHILPLAGSQDHKAVFDGDTGPNTGGMGAISPAAVLSPQLTAQVMERIMIPACRGMVTEGMPFVGVLYAGLMIKDGEPKVLEFNVRFGDPETQALIVRLKSDLVDVIEAAISGTLNKVHLVWDPRPSVCVVMVSGGYPGEYEKGHVISGLVEACELSDIFVFHAGTKKDNGTVLTDGGRVLGVTALGSDMPSAISKAYEAVGKIRWDGVHFRRDIGRRARI